MLPVWPFLMLTTGQLIVSILKSNRYTFMVKWIVKIYIITELITLYVMETKFRGLYKVRADLAAIEPPIHSVYLSEPLWSPHYTIMHRQDQKIKIYSANQNPMFYRQMSGYPLPITMDRKIVFCTQLIDLIGREEQRPEYIVQD